MNYISLALTINILTCGYVMAMLTPDQTRVSVTNESSKYITYLRIKARFTDNTGSCASGSVHINDLNTHDTQVVDLTKAYKKDKKNNGQNAGFVLDQIDKNHITSVLVLKVQPKSFSSRLKIKNGTTADTFVIRDNNEETYKITKSGEQHRRELLVEEVA